MISWLVCLVGSVAMVAVTFWHLPVLRSARQRMLAKGIASAMEHRSPFLGGSTLALEKLVTNVAGELGLSGRSERNARLGALICDVGLCAVPSELLRKPMEWTPKEQAVFDRHPASGGAILKSIPLLAEFGGLVRQHHTRFESERNAPFESRIISACSDYLQLIRHVGKDRAVIALERQSGFHYDPQVVEAIKKVVSLEK